MITSEAENQAYYDAQQAKEKLCAVWLRQQSKSVRSFILLSAAFGILNGVFFIGQAFLYAQLLHAIVIEQQSWRALLSQAILLLVLAVLRSLATYLQQYWGFEAGARTRARIRQLLLDKFEALGPRFLKSTRSGALSTLTLEHVEALDAYFSRYLTQHYLVGILPFIMIAVVMPLNWVAGLILLVTGPLIPLFMVLTGMGAAAAQRRQFLALSRMGALFLDRLQGLNTLMLFGQARMALREIQLTAEDFRERTMAVLRIAFLSSAVLEFFSALAVALIAVYVGFGLLGQIEFGPAREISLKDALFVLLLAPEFFLPLRQLAVFYHDKAAAVAAAGEILAVLDLPEEKEKLSPVLNHDESFLRIRQLNKSYGARQILKGVSFSLQAGEKLALVGASGAGKSTLLNLIMGLDQADSGSILLNGEALSMPERIKQIAWLGQSAAIFHGTIEENITLGDPQISRQNLYEVAEQAGVTAFVADLPNGLQTRLGEGGYGLSGGQIQRVAMARALLKSSPLILLDEPTAHLDEYAKFNLLNSIMSLFADRTLIVATHDPLVIARLDRSLHLEHGQIRP